MQSLRRLLFLVCATAGFGLSGPASGHAGEPVDVALVLAVDVSRSMSPGELEIQRHGYAEAIRSPEVVAAIEQGAYGRIAVAMYEWAADFSQNEIFGWTLIESGEDAERVAELILAAPGYGRNRTSISGAIRKGVEVLEASPYDGFRRVIDISGDGPNNQGERVVSARDEAIAKRIVINGLPLMTRGGAGYGFNIAELDAYYRDCVIGGPGSFLVPVTEWEQFPEAVRRKLVQEIGGMDPGLLPVMKAQTHGAAEGEPVDCEIGEKIWQQRQWMFDAR
ncbi:DUF1194 domain-containing protein [Pseudohoeflea suaedae]|uniref:DUF1194 domain-containing protein n=1 Tax=Pseudohoeflea suaedae TaxID=877384 RepID=A0A4R5PJJ9_9HYPH|nr:DUF1194 domain-containing protein [Pseudohoeflea suaedae]TDH35766.1 DUF1194 domain-containing protein [Pseudohoeflea suaedae]